MYVYVYINVYTFLIPFRLTESKQKFNRCLRFSFCCFVAAWCCFCLLIPRIQQFTRPAPPPRQAGGSSWAKGAAYKTSASSSPLPSFVFRNAPLILRLFDFFQSVLRFYVYVMCNTRPGNFRWIHVRNAEVCGTKDPRNALAAFWPEVACRLYHFFFYSSVLLSLLSIINSCKYLRHACVCVCWCCSQPLPSQVALDRDSMWVSPLGGCLIKTHTNFDPNPVTTTTREKCLSLFSFSRRPLLIRPTNCSVPAVHPSLRQNVVKCFFECLPACLHMYIHMCVWLLNKTPTLNCCLDTFMSILHVGSVFLWLFGVNTNQQKRTAQCDNCTKKIKNISFRWHWYLNL